MGSNDCTAWRTGRCLRAPPRIDLDHFKSINDDFGHDVGDAVLVAFASACQHQLRGNDRLGRFGGEEFLLIMPGFDAAQIPAVFQRLRDAVHSLGGAEAGKEDASLDALIKRADKALYRAKEAGRDRFDVG